MATPATGDGHRPALGTESRPWPRGYNLRHLSAEEIEKNMRLDPPRKSLRKPPRFSSDTPPDVVVPPPRPRTRRSKKASPQPPPAHPTSTTTTLNIPEPPPTTAASTLPTISDPSPTTAASTLPTISDPSPPTPISDPSPTTTSSILSKLRPPSIMLPNPVYEHAQGIESQHSSLLRPSPSTGPSSGPSTGHIHTQANICAGHDVHESGRQARGRETTLEGDEEKEEKIENGDSGGHKPSSTSGGLTPHHEKVQHGPILATISLVQAQTQPLDTLLAPSVHGEHDIAAHHKSYQPPTATSLTPLLDDFPTQTLLSPTSHGFSTLQRQHPSQNLSQLNHSPLSPTTTNPHNINNSPHHPLSPTHLQSTISTTPHSDSFLTKPSSHIPHSVVPTTISSTHIITPTIPHLSPTHAPPNQFTQPNHSFLSPTHIHSITSHTPQSAPPQTPLHPHHINNSPHHHLSPTLSPLSPTHPTSTNTTNHTHPPLSPTHGNSQNSNIPHSAPIHTPPSLPPSPRVDPTCNITPNQPPSSTNPTITPQPNNQAHCPSGPTYASVLNSNGPLKKSFEDIIHGPTPPLVPIKPVSSFAGEPSVQFSAEEVHAMAAPFKLTLVGKFSYNRPRMELIRKFFASVGLLGTSHISLLDNRHVLIKLTVEDDYTRLWVKQTWYVCGSAMRIFKWTTDFRCSEESPVVPVWVSFPYLPIHFVQCKEALFSIASAVGQPLRLDHATASLSRPSVARVLVEHDVTQALLPRIRIGVGDSGFWQSVVYERLPLYCASCKHLGHAAETCYVANPSLRPQRPNRAPQADPHMRQNREAPPPSTSPRVPDPTPEHSSLAIQIVDSGSPITVIFPDEADGPDTTATPDLPSEAQDSRAPDSGASLPCDHGEITEMPSDVDSSEAEDPPDSPPGDIDTTVVGFNTHCTAIPSSEETSVAGETRDGTSPRDGIETGGDVEICDGAIIEKLGDQRIIRCSEGFIEVTPRRSFTLRRRGRKRRPL